MGSDQGWLSVGSDQGSVMTLESPCGNKVLGTLLVVEITQLYLDDCLISGRFCEEMLRQIWSYSFYTLTHGDIEELSC